MTNQAGRSGLAPEPQPIPEPPPIAYPQDRDYPGVLTLAVDATDVERCIFRVRETIPIPGPGHLTLLYPKWLPGFHSPASRIELLAGLEIYAGGKRLTWRRDPVEVHAFHLEVPERVDALELTFQFLSPTAKSQGDIAMTSTMAAVHWGSLVLYPAGYFSRRISVAASLLLPPGWLTASALEVQSCDGALTTFAATPLDVLVDSPVLVGCRFKQIALDPSGEVTLNLFADRDDLLQISDDEAAAYGALISEADALFGCRPFDRYHFLAALSDELGGAGVEHHRSAEIVVPSSYFASSDSKAPIRGVFAHEYVHAWNGKFRRGADSWTPSFERPIRNSLMWVYEGLTQYWGEVLTARCGLWSTEQALQTLARTAAIYNNRPGGRWRAMSDTTSDPIIAGRQTVPWASWQRSEDYYGEGQLLWLDIDTLLRELTGERRSLDDFARRFFAHGGQRGVQTQTYGFADIVSALDAVASFGWADFITARLESRQVGAPLDGLERGGYQLVYRPTPSEFGALTDSADNILNLRFSIGVAVSDDGTLQEVIWEGPAFEAGLVAGARLLAVNGEAYDGETLKSAIVKAQQSGAIEVTVQRGGRVHNARIAYDGGLRFPHLEPIDGARGRLDEIYARHR